MEPAWRRTGPARWADPRIFLGNQAVETTLVCTNRYYLVIEAYLEVRRTGGSMKICHKCQTQLADDAEICTCGAWFRVEKKQVLPGNNRVGLDPEQNAAAVKSPLGIKWLIYWAYVHLPFTGIIGIGIGALLVSQIAWLGIIVIAICAPYLAASIGIYKRKVWGWWLNWLTVALNSINGLVPNSYETIGDPITSQVAGEFAVRLFFVSIIWILPNVIYWRKRRHLFS